MTSAGEAGYRDAADRITIAYALGDGLDRIAAQEHDRASWLLSEARGTDGQDYAREYDSSARTLIADLRADEAEAARVRPPAGTPHPDPRMAALGWRTCDHGIYTREGYASAADVAALERYAGADREAG